MNTTMRVGCIIGLVACMLAVLLAGCDTAAQAAGGSGKGKTARTLVIGMDGLDPKLLGGMMEQGRLPNFSKLAAQGTFKPLATSMPPQSPVAWSNFISGGEPGAHQIYDFIHRKFVDSQGKPAVTPFLSTSEAVAGEKPAWLPWDHLPWFEDYQIPLVSGKTVSLRKGDAFWNHLVAAGVDTVVYRVPANYPPDNPVAGWFAGGKYEAVSGMGTPDLRGTYGEFFHFKEGMAKPANVSGGFSLPLKMDGAAGDARHVGRGALEGPPNFLRQPNEKKWPNATDHVDRLAVPFEIVRDPEADTAKVIFGDQVVLLNKGEWSDWIPVELKTGVPHDTLLKLLTVPTSLKAMVRVYLKQVHPVLEIYTTPLNIDPLSPANPISTPSGFAADLAERHGRFYTTGIPEDTKALREGVLDEDEFLAQSLLLFAERKAQYRAALRDFSRGFLFFYFGSTDQLAHIFWRDRDPEHPGLREGEAERYGHVIDKLYEEMDELLGEAMAIMKPDETLMVVSDHGFQSFRRGFNVNAWLRENGYLELLGGRRRSATWLSIDWPQTKAYGLGINSVYINVKGREPQGIVDPGPERSQLLQEIAARLLEYHDIDGSQVVTRVYLTHEVYPGADEKLAPDLLIGYGTNYRGSWATAMGGAPEQIMEDNLDRWSGDHCVTAELVPGSIVCNRKVVVDGPALTDVAPTILAEYGVEKPKEMIGRPLFGK